MKVGDNITITPSEDLSELLLSELIFRTGIITEIKLANGLLVKGAWVELDGDPYLNEIEWYIPINSILVNS